jgi:hypothetical protein
MALSLLAIEWNVLHQCTCLMNFAYAFPMCENHFHDVHHSHY